MRLTKNYSSVMRFNLKIVIRFWLFYFYFYFLHSFCYVKLWKLRAGPRIYLIFSFNFVSFVAALGKIANRLESWEKSNEIDVLVKECCGYFCAFQESALHLECALNLVNVIEALHKHSEQREISKILSEWRISLLLRIGVASRRVNVNVNANANVKLIRSFLA